MAILPTVTATAHTYHRNWSTASRPVLLGASGGNLYVVKGRQNGRVLVNDHLVARLGALIGAPVTEAIFVDLPQALIDIEPQVTHMPAGISHGARWIPDCTERLTFDYAHLNENRHRIALLAIMYSWAGCWSDHQFIYLKNPPHHVYSVDHGHFFPSGPPWTSQGLQGAPPAVIDPVFSPCALTPSEIRKAAVSFQAVDLADVAAIVDGVPSLWGITTDERSAMTTYLTKRRGELLNLL